MEASLRSTGSGSRRLILESEILLHRRRSAVVVDLETAPIVDSMLPAAGLVVDAAASSTIAAGAGGKLVDQRTLRRHR